MNDEELVNKIKLRDEQAFKLFIDKYIQLFCKIIKRILQDLSTEDEVMDCLSEAFIYIWYHIANYPEGKYSFRNWCSLIVINRAQNHLTRLKNHENKVSRYHDQLRDTPLYVLSAEDTYIQNESMETIINKIDELPPTSRDIFKQRYLYGLKPRQIAEKMNISTKKVDNYLTQAKKKLRKEKINHETE